MSEGTQTQDAPETSPSVETAPPAEAKKASSTPSPVSPAQDLRDIQMLLVSGIFPGNAAPAIVKAYSMLEQMAKQVEASVESK